MDTKYVNKRIDIFRLVFDEKWLVGEDPKKAWNSLELMEIGWLIIFRSVETFHLKFICILVNFLRNYFTLLIWIALPTKITN